MSFYEMLYNELPETLQMIVLGYYFIEKILNLVSGYLPFCVLGLYISIHKKQFENSQEYFLNVQLEQLINNTEVFLHNQALTFDKKSDLFLLADSKVGKAVKLKLMEHEDLSSLLLFFTNNLNDNPTETVKLLDSFNKIMSTYQKERCHAVELMINASLVKLNRDTKIKYLKNIDEKQVCTTLFYSKQISKLLNNDVNKELKKILTSLRTHFPFDDLMPIIMSYLNDSSPGRLKNK